MEQSQRVIRLLKVGVGCVAALIVGIIQIATGEFQAIVSGSGAILAAVVVLGVIAYLSRKPTLEKSPDELREAEKPIGTIWLGIALTLLPGILYFYLKHAMTRFDINAIAFVSGPILFAGLACIGLGSWSLLSKR